MTCSISHCERPVDARGMCRPHYQRHSRGRDPENLRLSPPEYRDCPGGCGERICQGAVCKSCDRRIRMGKLDCPPGVKIALHPKCGRNGCEERATRKSGGDCKSHADMVARSGAAVRVYRKNGGPCEADPHCESPSVAKGACRRHYRSPHAKQPRQKQPCRLTGCSSETRSEAGYCGVHAAQIRTRGEAWLVGSRAPVPGVCAIPRCGSRVGREGGMCARHRARARAHGLSTERMVTLFERAECQACGDSGDLEIDHDHSCCPGQGGCETCVRGLLCPRCNSTLAQARDDQAVLRALITYLDRSAA